MCDNNNIIENNVTEAAEAAEKASKSKVSKYKIREQAFFLCFESLFSDTEIDELADNAGDARDEFLSDEAISRAKRVKEHTEEIDKIISGKLKKGWKLSRISKISLSILRLAIYEMLYMDDIPVSVSINEAVELSKKFSTQEDTAFINGVLGAAAKEL